MPDPALQTYLSRLQKSLLPGVAARGLALAREGAVQMERRSESDILLRIKGQRVTLWPAEAGEDGDQHCDCDEQADPCSHIAAACSALKLGLIQEGAPQIRYSLRLEDGPGSELKLERPVHSGAILGEIDQKIERALSAGAGLIALLPLLKELPGVEFLGRMLSVGPPIQGLSVEVREERGGFRLRAVQDPVIQSVHAPGVAVCQSQLRPVVDPSLPPELCSLLRGEGTYFEANEASRLVREILPALETKVSVTIHTQKLPQSKKQKPLIQIRLDEEPGMEGQLSVVAQIIYPDEWGIADPASELELKRWLQRELQLAPAQRILLSGLRAVEFTSKLEGLSAHSPERLRLIGNGRSGFRLENELLPEVSFLADGGPSLGIFFQTPDGARLSASVVFEAHQRGESHVKLLGGGFAPLPADWLSRFAGPLSRLLALQEKAGGVLPSYYAPEFAVLGEELGVKVPDPLKRLREMACGFEKLPEAALPSDLGAELRAYQKQGVDWLSFVRDAGMGALLADDMGLGKTLQALCAAREGRWSWCPPVSLRPGASRWLAFAPVCGWVFTRAPLASWMIRPISRSPLMGFFARISSSLPQFAGKRLCSTKRK